MVESAFYFEEEGEYALRWKGGDLEPSETQQALGTALFLNAGSASPYLGAPRCPHHHLKIASGESLWMTGTAASRVAPVVSGKHFELTPGNVFVLGRSTVIDMRHAPWGDLQVLCVEQLREKDTFVLAAVEAVDPGLALAEEFGVSTTLFRQVKAIVSETVKGEDGLSLSVEKLVDPELGKPVQLVFEVRGAASASDVTRIWEAINSRIETFSHTLSVSDFRSLVDYIGVHVHRA